MRQLHLHSLPFPLRAVGRLIGKALLDAHVMPVPLALPMYKHMLGEPISMQDLEFIDKVSAASAPRGLALGGAHGEWDMAHHYHGA